MFSPSLSKTKIRYEVNFQNGIECGGAYVKLLSKTPELNLVSNAATLSVSYERKLFHFVSSLSNLFNKGSGAYLGPDLQSTLHLAVSGLLSENCGIS